MPPRTPLSSEQTGSAPDLSQRLDALSRAVQLGAGRVAEAPLADARRVLDRARERLALSVQHTVVALAGATGCGKSSLFNALAGLDLSAVGPRRPTTGAVHACVWGTPGAGPLLDWLGVPERHRIARETVLDADRPGSLDGLVLLDLPDHDSTEAAHRLETDRLVELVDVLVWVVDPQKYADRIMHETYLRPIAGHGDVVVVALNQVDLLPPEAVGACESDLRRLLAEDGLGSARVVSTSTEAAPGVEALRGVLQDTVRRRAGASDRVADDVRYVADRLTTFCGQRVPSVDVELRDDLVRELALAAGVPTVIASVADVTRHRGVRRTRWPLESLATRLRPDLARRVGLGDEVEAAVAEPVLTPPPVQRSVVGDGVRRVATSATDGLPVPWPDVIGRRAAGDVDDVADALDEALAEVDLDTIQAPGWWRVVQLLQWLLLAIALIGAGWLVVLGAGRLVGFAGPQWPAGAVFPAILLVGGVVLGLGLGLGSRPLVGVAARHRSERAEARLHDEIAHIARQRVLEPIDGELDGYTEFCRELRVADGVARTGA